MTKPKYQTPHCILLRDLAGAGREEKLCPFCAIVEGRNSIEFVSETRATVAFAPLNPATEGHTLVVPKCHEMFLWDLPSWTHRTLMTELVRLARVLMDNHKPEGMNLIQSNLEAATQTVPHVHFHLVPRWKGDAMGTIWPLPSRAQA